MFYYTTIDEMVYASQISSFPAHPNDFWSVYLQADTVKLKLDAPKSMEPVEA